jgi:integrase/recombinase XerD
MRKNDTKALPWTPRSYDRYTRRRISRSSPDSRPLLRAFASWLTAARGLQRSTVTLRLASACSFVDSVVALRARPCVQALRFLAVDDVERFFVEFGKDHGLAARRAMRAAMRLFLQFAAEQDLVRRDLVDAVPSLPSHHLQSVPRGLSDEHLLILLDAPWHGTCPYRDRAIVYLLATYGVRRGQVCALRFADVDWQERTIGFAAHKGGKSVRHVLTEAVAESLADYLSQERPASKGTYVFLRHRRPHLRLGPLAVSSMVRLRMQACGLPAGGPHALRHAFATRLLRAGQPSQAIADLLGHRSLHTVAVYAKVDYVRLLESAGDWPEVLS